MLDVAKIRQQFPVYDAQKGLVFLDTAASSLKPKVVIDSVNDYYTKLGVNVHRGVYSLSYQATELYEQARTSVAKFLNAKYEEIIFTRGTTSSLNLVASSYTEKLKAGDEIITSELEHHSSLLPWMEAAKKTGAVLKYVELDGEGRITVDAFKAVLTDKTKVVALTYVSNVMGYITPIKPIIELAHQKGAIVVLDAAQAAPHLKMDVTALNVDFLAFSGHKMCGPSGIGVLFGKKHLLNQMSPVDFGGDMNIEVDKYSATWKETPYKFEAGTPIISGAIGLAKAIEYITDIGYDAIHEHVKALHAYTLEKLSKIKEVEIYNKTCETGIIAFNITGVHPHDAASIFDQSKVCIRAGHHCAQLVTKWLNQIATLRATFYIYNDYKDADVFIERVKEVIRFFGAF